MDRLDEWTYKSKSVDLEEDFYFGYGPDELVDFRDPGDLLAALKQKEEEVIVAAQLGNALLLENTELKEHTHTIHEEYTHKLEELEQGRHELRLKLASSRSQWENQVCDLERDVKELGSRVEQLTAELSEAERNKTRAQLEHSEHVVQLREELNRAMEVEKAMSAEMRILKEELQQKNSPVRHQDEELLSAMREQVLRLTQKEHVLEQRLQSVSLENTELRSNLSSLHTRLAQHDRLSQEQSQQVAEAWQEVEVARCRSQQLQTQVEELQEEISLQENSNNHRNASLLSELETETLGISREEIKQQMDSILQLLLPLTQDVNPSWREQGGSPQEDVQVLLLRLKGVAESLAQTSGPQALNLGFVEETADRCGNSSAAHELRDQNIKMQQENANLMQQLKDAQGQADIVHQAIRDRDDAISKKNLMEAELVRSKNDMMSLNNQLLEAIQRKLELSQELEAWQDDITIIINQQLRSQQQQQQQQTEQPQKKITSNGISLFHRPSTNQNKSQSPWKDWLRRGKGFQYGK